MPAILYAKGEPAARGADLFARRLAGSQGEKAVHLAAQAIRGVALGVVVTAILQSGLASIGLAIVGVPFVTILAAVMFVLCVAQVGPGLVLIPAVIWVYAKSGAAWGTGFLVWAIFCGTIDSVVRPWLIRRGADLPLLLIFAGVIGGLIAFGVIGLFIGPVVLAVAYTLLVDWVSEGNPDGPPSGAVREVKQMSGSSTVWRSASGRSRRRPFWLSVTPGSRGRHEASGGRHRAARTDRRRFG